MSEDDGGKQIRYITKTCKTCGHQFECVSTWRRTQWCPTCSTARKAYSLEGHAVSNMLGRSERNKGSLCDECGERGYVYHHITPLSKGGSKDIDNLQWLCEWCHAKKHSGVSA